MRIHFIGIGGIGVSALARYWLAQKAQISGSDEAASSITRDLEKLGAKVFIGHKKENLPMDLNLVVFSAAVPDDNVELVEARQRKIKCQTYAEALGELTKKMYTIAVSGMHGKSTTTAMVGLIMEAAGLDPTVILGTRVKEWGNSNCHVGQGPSARLGVNQYLVIEADEYDRSLLNYWPKILVLLNIEEEHLDTYIGGLPDIIKTFGEYIGHLPPEGILVANEEDKNIAALINSKSEFLISKQNQNSKIKIQKFNIDKKPKGLNLKIHGQHILSDTMAAITVARALGIADEISVKVLNNFTGAWRRMEYKGEVNGAKIYDDYGHHPTEIKATLEGARELLTKSSEPLAKLWCVFQPHQYHRTYDLFDKFVGAFDMADKVILLPIYSVAGREDEEIKKKVSAEHLALRLRAEDKQKEIIYLDNFSKAADYLRQNLKPGDVCLVMGAGDIYQLSEQML